MHELPITESILNIVITYAEKNAVKKVMAINLQVGMLSDLEDEWIQRYFDHLSKGTVAEGAKLKIARIPIKLQCNSCATSYQVEKTNIGDTVCPGCGKNDGKLISGREYHIKDMEVQ
jgi:hydrogenase nickel incorporation protein HypA/HybF